MTPARPAGTHSARAISRISSILPDMAGKPSPPSRTVEFVQADLDLRRAALGPHAGGARSA